MSRIPRAVVLGALVAAMSLGGIAHAQSSDTPSQPAGATQPSPTPAPGPTSPTTPTSPTSPTTPTSATAPPALLELTVNGSSRQGQVGATVALSADVQGCPQAVYASGVFVDHTGARRQLTGLTVNGGRLTTRYTVGGRDAVGWGHFTITCWRETPAGATPAGVGNWSFQVLPRGPGPLAVTASPSAGRPGTVVTVTADIRGGCDPADASFQDHKGLGVSAAAKHATIVARSDRQLVARYTVSNKDAVGRGRFVVACNQDTAGYRVGSASFQVRAVAGRNPSPVPNNNNNQANGGPQVNYGNDGSVQLPSEIDTGQGGTADGVHHSIMDPVWLLPLAGLVLIAVAVGLRLHQTSRRRP